MNESVELYTSKGVFVVTTQGIDGAKNTSMTLGKLKTVAEAFGLQPKSDDAKLKRDEASQALKVAICQEIGGDMLNPAVQGYSKRVSKAKNGTIRKTYTLIEPATKSASESAIASYLGLSVDEVRQFRAAKLKSEKPIETTATVKAEESPVTAGA